MRYVALIRAINVGGRSTLAMADLRQVFDELGFADVATHGQTGNVAFTAPRSARTALEERIGAAVAKRLGTDDARAFVRTRAELQRALERCPFDPGADAAVAMTHLVFLERAPDAAHRTALMAREAPPYRFAVDRDVVYYGYPKAAGGKRRSIDFEGILGARGTGRSIGVVRRLVELAAA